MFVCLVLAILAVGWCIIATKPAEKMIARLGLFFVAAGVLMTIVT